LIANLPKRGGISNFFGSKPISPGQAGAKNQKTEGNAEVIVEWLCSEIEPNIGSIKPERELTI